MWAFNKKYLVACALLQVKTNSDIDTVRVYLEDLKGVRTLQELIEKRNEFSRGEFLKGRRNKEALSSYRLYKAFERYSAIRDVFKKIWAAIDLYPFVKPFNGVKFDTRVVDKQLEEAFKEPQDSVFQGEEVKALKSDVIETVEQLKECFGTVRLISFLDKPGRDIGDNICVVLNETRESKRPELRSSLQKKSDNNSDCCVYDRAAFLVATTFFLSYCIVSVVKSSKGKDPKAIKV